MFVSVPHQITIQSVPSLRAGLNRYRMTCTHCDRKRMWFEREDVEVDFARYVRSAYPDTAYRRAIVTFA